MDKDLNNLIHERAYDNAMVSSNRKPVKIREWSEDHGSYNYVVYIKGRAIQYSKIRKYKGTEPFQKGNVTGNIPFKELYNLYFCISPQGGVK